MLVTFIDYKQAFDSVDRGVLWAALAQYGVDTHLISMVRALYENTGSRVQANGTLSHRFESHSGVLQGCPLSPLLFNVFLDQVLRDLQRMCPSGGGGRAIHLSASGRPGARASPDAQRVC